MSYETEVAEESERRKRAVRAMLPEGESTFAERSRPGRTVLMPPAQVDGRYDGGSPMPPSEGDVDALSNDRTMNEGSISPSMSMVPAHAPAPEAFDDLPSEEPEKVAPLIWPPISIPKGAAPAPTPAPEPPPAPAPKPDAGTPAALASRRIVAPMPGAGGDDTSAVSRYMTATKKDEPAPVAPAEDEGANLAFGGPVERFLQSFHSTATNGRYQPNFTEANRLDAQMSEPIKRAEAARKAREDAARSAADRSAVDARSAASLAETNRHNLATEGKTPPEKAPVSPIAKELALLDLPDESLARLGKGPKAAPVVDDDVERKRKADADYAEWRAKHPNASVEEMAAHHRAIEAIARSRAAATDGTGGSGGAGGMDDAAIDWWAANGVLYGLKPNLPRNSPEWTRIAAREPEWAKLNNTNPAEAQSRYKGLAGAQKAVETGAAKTNAYEGAADGAMSILEGVSAKVPRVGFAPLDSLLVKGAAMLPGEAGENARNMSNAAHTLVREYARVMTGVNGVTTDGATARAEQMLSDGMSHGTMKAVMEQFRQEFKARNDGNERELARISDAIKAMHPGSKAQGAPAVPAKDAPIGTRRIIQGVPCVKTANGWEEE